MTETERAVIDAARALVAWYDHDEIGDAGERVQALRAALAALDSEPSYRERVARLYRGEDKP